MQTGEQLLAIFNSITEDVLAGSASEGTVNSLTSAELAQFRHNELTGRWLRITQAGAKKNQVRRISGNDESAVTVLGEFAEAIAAGDTWEIHSYDPAAKFRALDRARISVFPKLCRIVEDESLYSDGESDYFEVPEAMRTGPFTVRREAFDRNIRTARGNMLDDDGWIAANGVTSVDRMNHDAIVPRIGPARRVSLAAGASATQALEGSFDGRRIAAWGWVYCDSPAAQVKLGIEDARSDAHHGNGWAWLKVEHVVAAGGTPTVSLSAAAAAVVFFEDIEAGFGRARTMQLGGHIVHDLIRDATGAHLRLHDPVERGYQLYLRGRQIFSALGDDPITQSTNIMELDEPSAFVLATLAVEELFLGLSIQISESIGARIEAGRVRLAELGRIYHAQEPSPPVQTTW